MSDRLDDLLTLLRQRFPAEMGMEEVEAFLAAEGYDRRLIGEVLTRLFGDVSLAAAAGRPAGGPFRVQGPHERGRFAPDAWGHLLALSRSGVLSAVELEHVIERALTHVEGRIALDDLRSLLEGLGNDDPRAATDHATVH